MLSDLAGRIDSMGQIESAATGTIEVALSKCDRLRAVIYTNDKTPVTDGFIDLYSGPRLANSEKLARVDVQVKGLTIAAGKSLPTSYRMTRTDLQVVRRHGTVLLFVVFVSPELGEVAHYATLSPFAVDSILGELPLKAKSAQVALTRLPSDSDEIQKIVGLAYRTQMQSLVAPGADIRLGDGQSLTIHSSREFDLSAPIRISPLSGDFAVEVEIAGGVSLPLPGELMIYPASYVAREADDLVVECGGIRYSRPTVRQIDVERHEVKLSEGLRLEVSTSKEAQGTNSVSLTMAGSLADRVKDIDFFLNVAAHKPLTYNGSGSPYNVANVSAVGELQDHRAYLGKLLDLFAVLDVDPRVIMLEEIDDAQHRRLGFVYESLVRHRPLHANAGEAGLQQERVGAGLLMLIVLPGKTPNTWRYLDPFNPASRHEFRPYRMDATGKQQFATIYEVVEQTDLPHILNLHLGDLVGAYEAIAGHEETATFANYEVLALIGAADVSGLRRNEFLRGASALNGWLLEVEGPTVIHRINRWQIVARTDEGLTPEDRTEIRQTRREIVAENEPRVRQLEACCAILLGDKDDISDCVDRLTESERLQMQEWPIWTLAR